MTPTGAAPQLPHPFAVAGFALTALLFVSIAPVLAYAGSLALFGLAHVSSELGYVRGRFAGRWPSSWWRAVAALLGAVIAVRIARSFGLWRTDWLDGRTAELTLVALLALAGGALLRGAGRWRQLAAALVIVALGAGAALAPVATILVLGALHNFTPVAFVVERVPAPHRTRWLAVCALLFAAIPALLLTGAPWRLLGALDPNLWALPGTDLARVLSASFPRAWHLETWVLFAFQAMVFLQLMHYGAVIHALPRTLPQARRPSPRMTAVAVGACALLAVAFFVDFYGARRIYGVAAALHAWLEVPVLLAALLATAAAQRVDHHQANPAANDELFASSDTPHATRERSGTSQP